MGDGFHRNAATQRLKRELLPLIDEWQAKRPRRLLVRKDIAEEAASVLGVTDTAVRRYLRDAVVAGELLEIKPRADWGVSIPGGDGLPELYAVEDADSYRLATQRPQVKGAGWVSFLISPQALKILLVYLRKKHGETGAKAAVNGSVVPELLYVRLVENVVAVHKGPLPVAQAMKLVDAVLEPLGLTPFHG